MCESVGKDDTSDHFDSKQSRESVDLLVTCHPSPSLITFAFRSSEVKHLLLDLDLYGITDRLGMFSLFLKRRADVLATRLRVVFQRILRLGSFPTCWRHANVTPIPKGPSSSSVANYRPISITPILSKVLEHLVVVCLGRFMEHCGVLPTTQFAYRNFWVFVMCFCVCHIYTLQSALESGRRPGLCRSTSALLLIGSTIREFSTG